jgi:hypothetical protein
MHCEAGKIYEDKLNNRLEIKVYGLSRISKVDFVERLKNIITADIYFDLYIDNIKINTAYYRVEEVQTPYILR